MTGEEAKAALSPFGPVDGYLNMHYPQWLSPVLTEFADGTWESFERSTKLTRDGRIRLIPTPGHTLGHMSVVVEQDDHLVLIGGAAGRDRRWRRP
jgi:N-acyl homoserine lactone hydrolase